MYSDKGTVALVQNPLLHARTKHINMSVHYTRELYEQGRVLLEYVPTNQMLADCLTKHLKKVGHEKALERIGYIQIRQDEII